VAWTSINSSLTSYLGIQGRRLTLGATASNVFLEAPAAGSMQIGLDHASTATAQGIKAHNVTVGTGASLTLAGGTGSTAGGAVILATSATTGTATAAVTCGADGSVIFDKLPSSAVTLGSNGRMTIEFTNNTTLTFRARGSDGTTRTATLTLA
jgi:predicted aconitase with swiveling domain